MKKKKKKRPRLKRKKKKKKPFFVEPMKAKHLKNNPLGDEWIYEIKLDGYRALAVKGEKETALISRNQKNLDAQFPELIQALRSLPVANSIFDGEIVALDDQGRSSFRLLQARALEKERP